MKQQEVLKEKRIELLSSLVNEIQNTIKVNKLKEDKRKISIYLRIAEYTYYSEVSIRKFLTGMIPKDISSFVNGIIAYGKYLNMNYEYLDKFAKEYIHASSAVLIESNTKFINKNNIVLQELDDIIRTEKFTKSMNCFMEQNLKIAYVSGYKLSGKTKSTMAYIHDYMNINNIYNYILWCNINSNFNLKSEVIDEIFSLCELYSENKYLDINVKEVKFFEIIKNNKCLFILDLNDVILTEEQIIFINSMSNHSKIILISSLNIDIYNNENFKEKCMCITSNTDLDKNEITKLLSKNNILDKIIDIDSTAIEKLYNITSGFPFVINYIVKKVIKDNKYGISINKSLEKYLDINEITYEQLSEKIVGSIWDSISKEAKSILMIVSIFSYSVSLKLIAYVSQIGFGSDNWIKALNECYNNNLLTHLFLSEPRCKMHSFIKTLIYRNLSKDKELLNTLINKTTKYYNMLCESIGETYNDLEKFNILDEYDEYNVISELLEILYIKKKYKDFINIDVNLKYYTYVRGYWNIGEKSRRLKRARAANLIGDFNSELEAYCDYINIMSKMKNADEAIRYINISEELIRKYDIKSFDNRILALFNHVKALYFYNCKKDYIQALNLWRENEIRYWENMNEYRHLVNTLWIDKCKYMTYEDLEKLYKEILCSYKYCIDKNFIRGVIDYIFLLCNINIKKYYINNDNKCIYVIEEYLKEVRKMLDEKNKSDIRNEAEYYRIKTIICNLKNNVEKMKENYSKALSMYELLGDKEDIEVLNKIVLGE